MLGILVVMLFTYTFLLDKLSYMFLGSHLFIRFAVTIVLLAPLGFLMGMPFPLGLRLVNAVDPKLIPWVFGVNGCFSVMGSILSVLIAMDFGFSTVFKLASIIYLMSIIVIQREYYHCNKNTL